MITTTISSSISVNPRRRVVFMMRLSEIEEFRSRAREGERRQLHGMR
jgi:hypothetical protein